MTRARGFTQDDAHIYTTREQMRDELGRLLTFVLELLRDYGLGEFYLENLRPGTYDVTFEFEGRKCSIALKVPESEETIVDLGGIACE